MTNETDRGVLGEHFNSGDALWYGLATVRILPIAFVVLAACHGGGGQIRNLSLAWRGVDNAPRPSDPVAQSFAAAPLAFGLRDVRTDPTAVGVYEGSGFVVRTTDNVAQYCSTRLGEMLARAGARLTEAPMALLETELLDYNVVEGNTFSGLVRIRAILRRGSGGEEAWSKTYLGKSKRWGRTHSPDNFNEALSSALADVAQQLVQDNDFARALVGGPAGPARSSPPPNGGPPGPSGG